ncbi:MAG: Na+/H+ antiporter NhaC family protein [Bythopirellula sp.]
MLRRPQEFKSPGLIIFLLALVASIYVGQRVSPTWTVEKFALEPQTEDDGDQFVDFAGTAQPLSVATPIDETPLTVAKLAALPNGQEPELTEQLVVETVPVDGQAVPQYSQLSARRHWGWWSFLPAFTAIALCWITKEPITSLLSGIIVGAMLIGRFNILDGVLVPNIGTPTAATILILYLWLLGGLMGIWAKTGASEAFADYMSANFVRGPRSAKFVAWVLGVVFFQGGTVSAVLVGTTVRPLADEEKVSHEELALIVDSTSSPIAVLLAFNAWPIYVQAFIGVAGVSYLATEADRVAFFFRSIPLGFYAIFAVLSTFLIAVEKHPALPAKLKLARRRARETGELNAPDSEPLAGEDPNYDFLAPGYKPSLLDFVLPLVMLLGVAIGTYLAFGSPKVLWAFGAALLLAAVMAWLQNMSLRHIVTGILDGQKGVVIGSVILLLAITVGNISQDVGGGHYLVSLLGGLQLYWILPATAFAIAVVIAFSTGTSWATFAVTLPLVMPLAFAVATNQNLAHPQLFMSICFAATLNGGVFGDQCSPISDTTILSSMCTGADLMDHVTTQIPVAMQAAALAVVGWTGLAWYCA